MHGLNIFQTVSRFDFVCIGETEAESHAVLNGDDSDKNGGIPKEIFEALGPDTTVGSLQAYNLPEENWNTTNLSFCVVGASGIYLIPLSEFS